MEDVLGRPLLADETVHHRNGVKDDNRPDNLEIWFDPSRVGSGRTTPSRGRERSWGGTHVRIEKLCNAANLVEVRGFEPLWQGDRLGLLRAHPVEDLTAGLPPAEGPSASPGAMSLGGPRAEPPR